MLQEVVCPRNARNLTPFLFCSFGIFLHSSNQNKETKKNRQI
jgi:hypothetical protein